MILLLSRRHGAGQDLDKLFFINTNSRISLLGAVWEGEPRPLRRGGTQTEEKEEGRREEGGEGEGRKQRGGWEGME